MRTFFIRLQTQSLNNFRNFLIARNFLAKSLDEAKTPEEKNYVIALTERIVNDPTFGKQRAMPEHFLSPELMDKLGYRYEKGDDK